MKIVLSHSGKQHSYYVAKALRDLGVLEKFYTSSYVSSKHFQELINRFEIPYLDRRFLPGVHAPFVEANWKFEIKELLFARLYGKSIKTQSAIYQRDESFDQLIARKIRNNISCDIFWGFQGSCLESLKAAKEREKVALYDFPSAHYKFGKQILEEEQKLFPEWSDSFAQLNLNKEYETRLILEPQIADHIFSASSFSKHTIVSAGIDENKVKVLPLGVDLRNITYRKDISKKNKPFKLLYVGRITQAKGIKYLLEAVSGFKSEDVELHMIGYVHGKGDGLKQYKGKYNLHPAMSQNELFKIYHQYDALVLPSLFEGFGFVIIEALAAGLPVIATPHTMGPDIIKDDKNGYIVSIRDINAIQNAIVALLNKTTDEYHQMRINARDSAIEYSWDTYCSKLGEYLCYV